MKRYQFRLQTVLRVRAVQEELAAAALREAQREVAASEEREAAARATLAARPDAAGPQTGAEFALERSIAAWRAGAVRTGQDAVAAAQLRSQQSRAYWSAAAMRTQALRRLDERHREAHRVEALREEARVVDDLVSARRKRGLS